MSCGEFRYNSVPKAVSTLKSMIKLRFYISYWNMHEQSGTETYHKHAHTYFKFSVPCIVTYICKKNQQNAHILT